MIKYFNIRIETLVYFRLLSIFRKPSLCFEKEAHDYILTQMTCSHEVKQGQLKSYSFQNFRIPFK